MKDRTATRRALLLFPECLACGMRAANGHHVLGVGRGAKGDDLVENIIGLCGSGTMGCHGAFHGNPYDSYEPVVLAAERAARGGPIEPTVKERRDREWVARRIGERLQEERPDVVAYLVRKLGWVAAADFLTRTYHWRRT